MAAPNWSATPVSWSATPVDWDPDVAAPVLAGAPAVVQYVATGPTRTASFKFLLLDSLNGVIGELHPSRDSPPVLTNRPNGSIKRRLSSLHLSASEANAVNPVTDRVMPQFVPGDGADATPLGVFLWADAVYKLNSYGRELDSTLHDQGVILGQPIIDGISFPTGWSIFDALFLVFGWAGFPDPIIDPIPGDGIFPAPQAWSVTESNSYYSVAAQIAQSHAGAFEPYFTSAGRPRVRVIGDLSAVIPELVYTDGPDGNIYGDDGVFIANNLLSAPNRYVVVDTSGGNGGVVASYNVPDEAPHSFVHRNWYSSKIIHVQGITSAQAALDTAQSYARQDVDSYEDIMWSGPFDPRHDTLDVVRVLGDDYLETEWAATLAAEGEMAHKGKKIKHAEVRVPGGIPGSPPVSPPDEPPPTQVEVVLATYEAEDATLTSVAAPSTGTGNWTTDAAGRFISPDGQRTRLLGANGSVDVSGGGAYIFNMPTDGGGRETFTGHTADIKNWGWNIVRCVVLPGGTYGQTTNVNATRDLVVANAAEKIVTMVYCLESQSPTSSNTAASTAPFSTIILPFFQALLAAVPASALPYLWINPNGENREDSDYTAWKSLNDYLYTSIRAMPNGATVMLAHTTYNFGQTPLSVANWNTFATGKTRVCMDWHMYGALGSAASYETARTTLRTGNVPFLSSEFGWQYDGVSACCGSTWAVQHALGVQAIDDWYAGKGESVIAWIGTSDTNTTSGYSMRNPPGGYLAYSKARSDMGEHLWNVRALVKGY